MRLTRTDIVFLILAILGGAACFWQGGLPLVGAGMAEALGLLLIVLPQLAAGLLMGGLISRLVSRDRVAALLGQELGMRGLMLASFAGAITPGGPFTSFPVVHALWVAGADAGALIAYLTSWALIGVNRLIVWELPLMGAEFTLVRTLVCLPLPILAGLLARALVRLPIFALRKAPAE
ncbi:MAG: permease [Roseicyclus sp.]|uniref:permease n=1 Tax=Roseicyclus sp. TaxID=1914329 RepID=UPI003A8601DE